MNWINAQLTTMSDLVLGPVESWPPQLVLILVSVVCGVAMTIVFRYTSNQKALRRVADRTKAQLLCMRLFKDDVRVALGCQKELVKAIGLRLWHSLPPMLFLIVPFVFILTQLALRYEKRPPHPGESVITTLELDPARWADFRDASIQVPAGVTVETPALRDEAESRIYWRLRVDEPVEAPLRWRLGYDLIEKSFIGTGGGGALRAVSPRRPGPGFWDRLLYAGEPGFSAGAAVQSIDVRYPRRSTPFFGVDIPWWATFLIVSMATALVVRPFLKVQF